MSPGNVRTYRSGPPAVATTLVRVLGLSCAVLAVAHRDEARAKELPPGGAATALANLNEESPEERLARGRQAYLRNDFRTTISTVHDLLYPEIRLRSDEDVQSAHRLLALAYLFSHAENHAETEFTALLQLKPDFALDTVSDPPAAIAFLETLKKRERERMEEIERRRREEADRAAREDERRRAEEEARKRKLLEEQLRTVVEKHAFVLNFVPFGAGQFQNGERLKAWVFFGSQLALGATSVATWAALQIQYNGGRIKVPPDQQTTASGLNYTAVITGGAFLADVGFGIIDALLHYRSQIVYKNGKPIAPAPRATLAPFAAPGGGGMAVGGSF